MMKTNLTNACFSIAVFVLSLPTALLAEPAAVKSLGDVATAAGTHTLDIDPKTHSVWIAFAKGEESLRRRTKGQIS